MPVNSRLAYTATVVYTVNVAIEIAPGQPDTNADIADALRSAARRKLAETGHDHAFIAACNDQEINDLIDTASNTSLNPGDKVIVDDNYERIVTHVPSRNAYVKNGVDLADGSVVGASRLKLTARAHYAAPDDIVIILPAHA